MSQSNMKLVSTVQASSSTAEVNGRKRAKVTVKNSDLFSKMKKTEGVVTDFLDRSKYEYLFNYLLDAGFTNIPDSFFEYEYQVTDEDIVFYGVVETVARVAFALNFYKLHPESKLKMVKTINFNMYKESTGDEKKEENVDCVLPGGLFDDVLGDY